MYDEEYTMPDIPGNKGWYHPDDLFPNLPKSYDLILIDGPGGSRWGRAGFLKHIDQFNTDVPLLFDDAHRTSEEILVKKTSEFLGRPYKILDTDKALAYIL